MLVNLNKIVWSKLHEIPNEILNFLTKNRFFFNYLFLKYFYNHFWQRVDAILEDVSVAELTV